MERSIYLGKLFGVDLRLHWTFLAVLVPLSIFLIVKGQLAIVGLILMLIACVLLHEFGHIFAARRFGNDSLGITLSPIGGVAELNRASLSPKEEIIVALAGPLVNVALAGLAFIGIVIYGFSPDLKLEVTNPILTLFSINVVLAIFNLIPAYPMDGGRILRGILWTRIGESSATRFAARTGQALALAFCAIGIFWDPILAFIGMFIYFAASAEIDRLNRANKWDDYFSP